MAYFKFDNKKVYYNIIGNGEPILLLAGNTASSKIFDSILETYSSQFKIILLDFPGHGKSERVEKFQADFWYYNSTVCYSLLEYLKMDSLSVIGTSGGALAGINLALEHPEMVKFLAADSFMGEYPFNPDIAALKEERENAKKNEFAAEFWKLNHGNDWENVIDCDTEMMTVFYKSGKSFFHRSISQLSVPALLTASKKDEFCNSLDKIYAALKQKNNRLTVHIFESGGHPAMLSNADTFFKLIKAEIIKNR